MCTPSAGAMLPYGLKIPSPYFPFGPGGGVAPGHLSSLDFQRSQINDYNVRVQLGLRNYQHSLGLSPFHAYLSDPYAQAYFYKHDPRARFVQEEPKPSHSYIGLIGMAILNSKEKKLVLSDIYQWILDNYPYFRTRGPGWRNSIRHNLSLNDCFIKSGRSANGKGHYWAVHPANVDDFERGDFRRRRAQRKVRRHMGLSVPDDDDSPSPSPTQPWVHHDLASPESGDRTSQDARDDKRDMGPMRGAVPHCPDGAPRMLIPHPHHPTPAYGLTGLGVKKPSRKRLFDMASLLAPDDDDDGLTEAKIGPGNKYEDESASPGHNRHNNGGDSHEEEKYSREISRVALANHVYENPDMSDDDGDNEDDDDNIEEIHVTSDDESTLERQAMTGSKCDTDRLLSTDCDSSYPETKTNETNLYGVRHKDHASPSEEEDTNAHTRSGMLNGLGDKENILQNKIQEMFQKSRSLDNHMISRDNVSAIYDRGENELQRHQDVPQEGLPSYHSPVPHAEQPRSLPLNHESDINTTVQEHLSPTSPMNRADRLNIPLSISVNTSNFSPPASQNSNLLRRSSESSEALPSQNSLLFRSSPYKGEIAKLAEAKPPPNGAVRRTSLDPSSVPVPDIMRLQAEGMTWQPFHKDLVRERFSAFNVLDGRTHGLVGHFHQGMMRGITPFSPQSMLAHSSALTQGISSPMQAATAIPVAAIPSPGGGQHSE